MAGKMFMQKNRNCRFFLLESTVGSKIDENRCKQKNINYSRYFGVHGGGGGGEVLSFFLHA